MGQLSVLVMIAEEETDNLKMFCRGGENCCGKESNRLCDEGERPCSDEGWHDFASDALHTVEHKTGLTSCLCM